MKLPLPTICYRVKRWKSYDTIPVAFVFTYTKVYLQPLCGVTSESLRSEVYPVTLRDWVFAWYSARYSPTTGHVVRQRRP